MKDQLTKLSFLFLAIFGLLFSACESDLYQDAVATKTEVKTSSKYVDISKVPFLIPTIQQYNSGYKYLSSNASSNSREELDLDLEHVFEYAYSDGKKSYSISIKKEFEGNEDRYFENLHIYQKDNIYEAVIIKYNLLDDTKEFNLSNFTGTIETFKIDRSPISIMTYTDGTSDYVKTIIGCWVFICWENGTVSVGYIDGCDGNGSGNEGSVGSSSGPSGPSGPGSNLGTSGSGGSTGSNNSPNNNPISSNTIFVKPIIPWDVTEWQKFKSSLSSDQIDFLSPGLYDVNVLNPLEQKIKAYLVLNEFDDDSKDFMSWAITYLDEHANTTWEMFENQFMGEKEFDGIYDESYWDNPNLTFPAQSLPSWTNFYNAFPKHVNGNYITSMNNHEVYNLVGGHPKTAHLAGNSQYQNACALRGSRGLNYSYRPIGIYTVDNQQVTEKGEDNNNYILNARAFNMYMNKTFGPPTFSLQNSNNTPLSYTQMKNFLIGKTGIYNIINYNANTAGYSGHVDLIVDGQCLSGADINPAGGILKIEIWELN